MSVGNTKEVRGTVVNKSIQVPTKQVIIEDQLVIIVQPYPLTQLEFERIKNEKPIHFWSASLWVITVGIVIPYIGILITNKSTPDTAWDKGINWTTLIIAIVLSSIVSLFSWKAPNPKKKVMEKIDGFFSLNENETNNGGNNNE